VIRHTNAEVAAKSFGILEGFDPRQPELPRLLEPSGFGVAILERIVERHRFRLSFFLVRSF
jgi:hypothetical protein